MTKLHRIHGRIVVNACVKYQKTMKIKGEWLGGGGDLSIFIKPYINIYKFILVENHPPPNKQAEFLKQTVLLKVGVFIWY